MPIKIAMTLKVKKGCDFQAAVAKIKAMGLTVAREAPELSCVLVTASFDAGEILKGMEEFEFEEDKFEYLEPMAT